MTTRKTVAAFIVSILLCVASLGVARAVAASTDGADSCQFLAQPAGDQAAFCDTFDQPSAANTTRSGPLDPTVWGVSEVAFGGGDHYTDGDNPPTTNDTVAPVTSTAPCGGTNLLPPANLQVCDDALYESTNDDGGQTALAAYPRQPFDIANRAGDVTFNLSNNTQGDHAAWPTFVYTDQPVPAPYADASGIVTSARNSFGIEFDGDWGTGNGNYMENGCPYTNGVYVGDLFETVNYQLEEAGTTGISNDVSTPFGTWQGMTCLKPSASPSEQSHYEIQISTNKVVVWGESWGTTNLVELGELDNATLPLTRGLVWLEDDHYNGDKFNTEQSDTFGWSDFGFDGPVLPRDLGFDVSNEGTVNSTGAEQLGYADGSTVQTTGSVTAADISAASGALVELNWYALAETMPTVSLNGSAGITEAWPFGNNATGAGYGPTYVWRTVAYSVPLADVAAGVNSIKISGSGNGFANVDLILQGAGGVPTCLDPSDCGAPTTPPSTTPSASPTATPTLSPTPSPSPSATPTPMPSPTATPAPTPSPTPSAFPCVIVNASGKLQTGTCTGFAS